jgi:hypothetical protein
MDHLAEQIYLLVGIIFQGAITDLNCIFNAIAKAEMTGNQK